ncbi:MAG: glucose-6-phosphate isomerase [Gammaproteobacteria bacterium]|nr:glucose-6-phosphate isomerase [Gammaproteobacteria bacterium]
MLLQTIKAIVAQQTTKSLADLCQDVDRYEQLNCTAAGLTLDTSRQRIETSQFEALCQAADQSAFSDAFQQMREGAVINNTEGRAVLHTLLRNPGSTLEDAATVSSTLDKMRQLATAIQNGEWRGHNGQRITDVVNIGIGGSDLGPRMIYRAMLNYRKAGITVHWVANIDPADIEKTLSSLNPDSTLFVVSSKSFSTPETLNNANAARKWLVDNGVSDISRHVVAASSNVKMAVAFGIDETNIFPLWDWVGGRFSLWSAIGLPLMIGLDDGVFEDILAGACAMDEHTQSTQAADNLPAQLALMELWNSEAFSVTSRAVLPYCHDLRLLPAHLQQLEMESLGKQVTKSGDPVTYNTGGVVWGTEGSNGQHSYHQLLHQGTQNIAMEIILPLTTHADPEQHLKLIANALAQSQAFCYGQSEGEAQQALLARGMDEQQASLIAKHKAIPGNRPHSIITMDALTPSTLGALVAAYENKVFLLGYWLDINAFDQWGVELGKVHASAIENALTSGDASALDKGYNDLINRYRRLL